MELLIKSIILGIVEGITEFLPISSTGHLILVNQFINFTGDFATMFDVVIQLGAILSVIVYFWNRLYPFSTHHSPEQKKEIWMTWEKAIIGVIPALILGAAFGDTVEEYLFNPLTVTLALFIGGVLLVLLERRTSTTTIESISQLTLKTVLAIGLFQCLAMVPGTSRAAATIIGAMALGASRVVAAEFSFFLAIPTMVAASGYSLLKHGASIAPEEWRALAVGFVVSFLVAWGVIAFLMNYIRKHDFTSFGYYRITLALVIAVFMAFKILPTS